MHPGELEAGKCLAILLWVRGIPLHYFQDAYALPCYSSLSPLTSARAVLHQIALSVQQSF